MNQERCLEIAESIADVCSGAHELATLHHCNPGAIHQYLERLHRHGLALYAANTPGENQWRLTPNGRMVLRNTRRALNGEKIP